MNTSTHASPTRVGKGDRVTDRSANAAAMGEHDHLQRSAGAGILGFVWHFVQMVIVMGIGMAVYHLFYVALDAPLGISAALRPYPAVKQLLMDISMVVPMVAFMWYRRASWRRNMEMAGAMMAGPLVFMACLQFGLHRYVPGLSVQGLKAAAEVSMYLGMLAVMLYRRDEHAHGHGVREHAGSSQASTMGSTRAVHETH